MNILDLLDLLWNALRGRTGGIDFIAVYTALAAVLWGLLLFKVFMTEALQVATGHQTELPRIFVKYMFVAGMLAAWPMASDSLFNGIKVLADTFYPNLNDLLDTMYGAMEVVHANQQAEEQNLAEMVVGALYNFSMVSIAMSAIGFLCMFLCYALILLNVMGSLTILAMNLVLGPVFFALAFDKDFRSHASHWFSAVLSYLLLLPLYGAALTVAATIAGAAQPTNLFGLPSSTHVMAQLLGPLMAVGVVFSTNKVINALVGGAAGSGLGSTALGLAGIGMSLIPGVAMMKSTAVAGGAAAKAAAGAGKGMSSTAKSAMGGKS